jgi:hypothetical protein
LALTRDRIAATEARIRQIIEARVLEEARRMRAEAERNVEEERSRSAIILNEEERATFIKRIQEVLKQAKCYEGAINGNSADAQKSLDRYINSAREHGKDKPARIELAKATASDFDSWLKEAGDINGAVCVRGQRDAQSAEPMQEKEARRQTDPQRASPRRPSYSSGGGGGSSRPIQGIQ